MLPIQKKIWLWSLKIFWAEVSLFWAIEVPPWVLPEFLFFMQNLKLISHGTLHRETYYLVILLICYHKAIIWIYNVEFVILANHCKCPVFICFLFECCFRPSFPSVPSQMNTSFTGYYEFVQGWPICHEQFNLYCSFFYLLPKLKWQFMWNFY